ncbi:hypothetical protein EH230_07600 [Flavobacterium columnare]|uniref:histidine kinase n=1 Tax=Flavobacterium columnare TaxID=996 RepID=A0A437UAX1_9FLAO|nr:ATP-binding protein [Flavobacterium columnare]RVU90770.1 hypothetical protein EH230_07600 [Flavobacterium columnare]
MNRRLLLISLMFFLFSCKKEVEIGHDLNIEDSSANTNSPISLQEDKKRDAIIIENELQKNTHNTSSLRKSYFKLAGRYYNLEDSENYLRISRIAFKLAKEAQDPVDIAKGYHYIGDYFYLNFKNDSAYYYFTRSEKNYELLKKTKELTRVKFSKADILLYEKDFSGAEVEFIKVLKIAKAINYTRLIYDCYLNLGNVLVGLNSPDEAIAYYNKALSTINLLTKDPQYEALKAQVYIYLGKAYSKKKAYHEAIVQYDEGLLFSNPEKIGSYTYSSLISNKAYAEMQLDNLEIAEEKLYESLKIRKKDNNIPGIVLSNIYLGELYLYKKDVPKAISFLRNAKKIASENKILEDELRALRLLSKIDKKNQYDLYEEYINLSDSIQTVEFNKRNSFARIEYETDEILTEKQIIQEEKEQISSQRWLILFGSSGMIILLILLYNNKSQSSKNKQLQFEREQQESNEQIYKLMLQQQHLINDTRQQEKKRISQELHDGVMSKLTSTRLNLFILSKRQDQETIEKCLKHIENIQNIEKELRNISHDLNQETFLEKESFKLIIQNLFEDYCNAINIEYILEIDTNIVWEAIETSVKIDIYRILQECLQNTYKYSHATLVILSIKKVLDRLIIDIEDNGVGFDINKVKEGIGIKNINSRAKSMNGEVKFYSTINKGTHINLSLPY